MELGEKAFFAVVSYKKRGAEIATDRVNTTAKPTR